MTTNNYPNQSQIDADFNQLSKLIQDNIKAAADISSEVKKVLSSTK